MGRIRARRGLVDQVLLLCLQYDPTTGKYGMLILGSLRLTGIATVAVLVVGEVTPKTLAVNFPPEYGVIKEVKLDGTIFKTDDSSLYPNGVLPGETIGAGVWTNPDKSKRQLDPGEIGAGDDGATQDRAAEYCSTQISAAEVRVAEVSILRRYIV